MNKSQQLECNRNATNRTCSVRWRVKSDSRRLGVDVEDQPQCRGIRHINSPSAPSLSSSPSSPPPSFTQSPSLQRSLMRVGQTSPQRPLLVFSRSLHYPLPPREKLYNHYPLSPCEQVILGTAVINTHTKHHSAKSKVRLTWTRGSVQNAKLFSYV